MQIHFSPEKKVYEFWKCNRTLIEGKDYYISHGRIAFAKPFKGKLEFEYDHRLY